MIELRNIEFSYGTGSFRLDVPELKIPNGERTAVIGPSGSGKTTLLNLMAGIIQPEQGRIVVAGTDLSALDDSSLRNFRITRMGLIFQEFELLEYLSVLENILLPFRICRELLLDDEVRDRAVDLLEQVEMADKSHRFPAQLSQGERQRVAVLRALIAQPKIILADEPTGNLDPGNKERVLDILLRYAQERDATLVTVTHDHGLIPRFDRVIDCQSLLVAQVPPRAAVGE